MPKQAAEVHNLTCPSCGHDRFQKHERGTFVYDAQADASGGEVKFKQDEVAVQCLKCLSVFLLGQLVK